MTYHLGNGETTDMTFTPAEAAETSYQAGVVSLRAGRNAEALRLLDSAYAQNPRMAHALIGIGIAMQRLKRWSEARERFRRYLREVPTCSPRPACASLVDRARRGVSETTAALEATGSSGPKPPASEMDPQAYAAARGQTPDQIAAGTELPPSAAYPTSVKVAVAAVALLGIGGLIWAVARR